MDLESKNGNSFGVLTSSSSARCFCILFRQTDGGDIGEEVWSRDRE